MNKEISKLKEENDKLKYDLSYIIIQTKKI